MELKLITLPSKTKNESNLTDYTVILPELPFYGIGGTIYRVEETEDSYYKVIYNANGSINPQKIPVPKNKKRNFKPLLKDYCHDLKNYLDKVQNQYIECESNITDTTLTNKQFYTLALITLMATIASIPFLFSTAWIGLVFSTISALSFCILCDIHKKDIVKLKKQKQFKKQYIQYQRDLANYRSSNPIFKNKNDETNYTKINEVDKSYLKIFPKIRRLKKDNYNEAA